MVWRCFLSHSAVAAVLLLGPKHALAGPTTFTADVAPLLFRHCASCHRPGGSSTTPLLTYPAARARARQIVQMTESRQMPPWQPDGDHGTFIGDRRLTPDQIAVFRRWLDDGVVEGDPGALPSAPSFPSGWELGTPDLVLTMPPFTLRADGADMFRNFVLPVDTTRMRYVRAWEFHPGNPGVVHHATMQVDATGASRRYDDDDPAAGYEGLIAPAARAPDGFFLDWAPGHRPNVAVPGTAWPLPAASELVMMLHLRPSGRAETVQASVALYFSESPPDRVPVMLRLTRQDLDIPAGVADYAVTDRFVLPVDVDLYTVQPHGHYVARQMTGTATWPDGATTTLLRIADWDFNWQDVYHFARPLRLPAGSSVAMSLVYDNTAANPRNPHSPPIRVGYGQQTNDEMAEMWFQVVPVRDTDRAALVDSLYRKVLPEEIKGRVAMLQQDPRNIALRDDLALLMADAGDLPGAEREFRATLAMRPDRAATRFNVGLAVLAQGRRQEAREYFASALTVDPSHGLAHFQLGLLAQAEGKIDDAAQHLASAVAARPSDADVLLAAGVVAAMRGETTAATQRLARALELKPGWANAQAALASVLSSQPGAREQTQAIALAEEANRRTGRRNSAFLDILAEALARAGQMPRALAVSREAIQVAIATGDQQTAERIRRRLQQWERP